MHAHASVWCAGRCMRATRWLGGRDCVAFGFAPCYGYWGRGFECLRGKTSKL